jgi:hypothetical protein
VSPATVGIASGLRVPVEASRTSKPANVRDAREVGGAGVLQERSRDARRHRARSALFCHDWVGRERAETFVTRLRHARGDELSREARELFASE